MWDWQETLRRRSPVGELSLRRKLELRALDNKEITPIKSQMEKRVEFNPVTEKRQKNIELITKVIEKLLG